MILYYVRHGDPIYHPDQLTPLGHRQAEAAAKRLALYGVDEIYSSTSIRAQETAEHTCELTGKPLTASLEWMHERYCANAFRAPMEENGRMTWIWAHPKYATLLCSREVREMGDRWHEHPAFRDLPFREYYQETRQKLDEWLASLGLEHDREKGMYRVTADIRDKRVALFAHEGFAKVFMSELLDIPYPYYVEHFEMKHTGITAILFDQGWGDYSFDGYARARILTLSNDSHLYREGLSTYHNSTGTRQTY